MAQRKQLSWTELRVGLFVLVGLLVLAVGIFYVTGYGFLGAKYRLYAYLPEVARLAHGAPAGPARRRARPGGGVLAHAPPPPRAPEHDKAPHGLPLLGMCRHHDYPTRAF